MTTKKENNNQVIVMSPTADICESSESITFTLRQAVASASKKMKLQADKRTLSPLEIKALLDLIKGVKELESVDKMLASKDFLSKLTDEELLELVGSSLLKKLKEPSK